MITTVKQVQAAHSGLNLTTWWSLMGKWQF